MSRSILVVDDIAANRNLLGATLEPHGYEVLLAPNGAAALKVAARARPNLILMDVNMPEMDGYEACRQLKQTPGLAETPVIFITANDDAESLVKGFQAGGVDYITKPFKDDEVLMRVATHVKIAELTRALEGVNAELGAKNAALESEVDLRKAAEAQANAANEAKSRFLAFISHEMRSPLNAIIGFSEELGDALQGDPQQDAQSILRSGRHLLGLINNLLDLSKIEAGRMPLHLTDFSPGELVRQLALDVEPLITKRDNRLVVRTEGVTGTIHADATKLKQVLLNLLSNAAKFTHQGEIGVSLTQPTPDQVRIDVRDSGIGMTSAEQGRLFEAYNQANRETQAQYGGTGLGLAISRQYCRLMGGDLTVASVPGSGSTFSATIPVRVTAAGPE